MNETMEQNKKADMKRGALILLGLIVIFIVAIIVWFGSLTPEPTPQSAKPSVTYTIGDTVTLKKSTLLGREKDDYTEAKKAMDIGDQIGFANMVRDDKAAAIIEGTKVLILDSSLTMIKVRVLTGGMTGFAGWGPQTLLF